MPNSAIQTISPGSLKAPVDALQLVRALEPEMPVQHLLCLLIIAREENREEGLTVSRLGDLAGMTLTSASRAVNQLSRINRQQEAGLNLVVAETNWLNRREKHLKLTPRGKQVVTQFLNLLEK